MILNILKNSKSTLRLLILFLFLALFLLASFLLVRAQQTSDYKRCDPDQSVSAEDCTGLLQPGTVCYNGWVPGKKTDCGPACPLGIYDNEIGYGRPWSKYTWIVSCNKFFVSDDEAYCYWAKTRQFWYSLGDKAEPECPNCRSRKTGYLASGQCDPGVSGGFYKVCCKPDGTVGESNFFVGDTVNPPYESVCTVGQAAFLISVPELGIYQPPEANTTEPNSGDLHPACQAGLITCTYQVSGNQVTFTANSTQTGTIKILVGNRVVQICSNTKTCSYETSGTGNITLNATFGIRYAAPSRTTWRTTSPRARASNPSLISSRRIRRLRSRSTGSRPAG
jgi:hypothetical protein